MEFRRRGERFSKRLHAVKCRCDEKHGDKVFCKRHRCYVVKGKRDR